MKNRLPWVPWVPWNDFSLHDCRGFEWWWCRIRVPWDCPECPELPWTAWLSRIWVMMVSDRLILWTLNVVIFDTRIVHWECVLKTSLYPPTRNCHFSHFLPIGTYMILYDLRPHEQWFWESVKLTNFFSLCHFCDFKK